MDQKVVRAIYERDWYRCRACGSGQNLQIHHILYRSHGGTDDPDNLVLLCRECHQAAHGIGGDISRAELRQLVSGDHHSLKILRRQQ